MVNREVTKFNYPEVVVGHYRYRGAVVNHNTLRHDCGTNYLIVLESACNFFLFS